MKQLCFLLLTLILPIGAIAEVPALSAFKQTNDAIVTKFNSGDYKGIYEMGGDYFKFIEKPDEFAERWGKLKIEAGEISYSEMIDDLGRVKHFRWVGEKKEMKLELWLEGPQFTEIYLTSSIRQPSALGRPVRTDNSEKTVLDSIVQKYATVYMSDPKAVGLSIGVYKDGKTNVYDYGEVEKGSGMLPTGNTFFNVGSVAKTFVGILLARAVLEHKVNLQDDVRKYLKGDYPNLAYEGVPIRLVNLANHTSGLPHWIYTLPKENAKLTLSEQVEFFASYSEAEFERDLHKAKLGTMPGSKYLYSSSGIGLLNLVLESVYGEKRDDLIRRYFGRSIGMNDTRAHLSSDDIRRYAKGYDAGELMPRQIDPWAGIVGTNSTTNDMLKYVRENVSEKDEAIMHSHCPTFGNLNDFAIGLVWDIENTYDRGKRLAFSGFNPGYITVIVIYPEKDMGFVFWANEDSMMHDLFTMERNIVQSLESR